MDIIYSDQPIELRLNPHGHSVFLVGPTPRDKTTPSWRPTAIQILTDLNYKGQVLVPERSDKTWKMSYEDQVEWEHYGLEHCSSIAVWVPRNMITMPALTTNVEFGLYVRSGRIYYGRPDDAEKCRYLDWLYSKYNQRPIYNNLNALLKMSSI